MKYLFSVLLSLLCLNAIADDDALLKELESMIPSAEIMGYTLSEAPVYYIGDDLFSYINGGADLFLEYGSLGTASAIFSDAEGNTVKLELYLMDGTAAAFGIYSIHDYGQEKVNRQGQEYRVQNAFLESWKNRVFVRIAAQKVPLEKARETLFAFADKVVNSISGAAEYPLLLQTLFKCGVTFQNPKYFSGLIALNNIFSFGTGAVYGFIEGVSGTHNGMNILVMVYSDEKNSDEWFRNAKGKIMSGKKFFNLTDKEQGFTVVDKEQTMFSFFPDGKFFTVIYGGEYGKALPLHKSISGCMQK